MQSRLKRGIEKERDRMGGQKGRGSVMQGKAEATEAVGEMQDF